MNILFDQPQTRTSSTVLSRAPAPRLRHRSNAAKADTRRGGTPISIGSLRGFRSLPRTVGAAGLLLLLSAAASGLWGQSGGASKRLDQLGGAEARNDRNPRHFQHTGFAMLLELVIVSVV